MGARQARKLWQLLKQARDTRGYLNTFGMLDPVQVTQAAKYLSTTYVSGWQCSSTASTSNEPGPDFADYPMARTQHDPLDVPLSASCPTPYIPKPMNAWIYYLNPLYTPPRLSASCLSPLYTPPPAERLIKSTSGSTRTTDSCAGACTACDLRCGAPPPTPAPAPRTRCPIRWTTWCVRSCSTTGSRRWPGRRRLKRTARRGQWEDRRYKPLHP